MLELANNKWDLINIQPSFLKYLTKASKLGESQATQSFGPWPCPPCLDLTSTGREGKTQPSPSPAHIINLSTANSASATMLSCMACILFRQLAVSHLLPVNSFNAKYAAPMDVYLSMYIYYNITICLKQVTTNAFSLQKLEIARCSATSVKNILFWLQKLFCAMVNKTTVEIPCLKEKTVRYQRWHDIRSWR